MLPLDQLPSMSQVIEWANEDYEKAAKSGDLAGMMKAKEIMEKASRLGRRFGLNARPADVYNAMKTLKGTTEPQVVKRINGTSFFQPLAYMQRISRSLPWPAGTKPVTERIAELNAAAEAARLASDKQKFASQLEFDKAKLGFEKEKFEWEKPWLEKKYQYELNRPYFAPRSGSSDTLGGFSERDIIIGNALAEERKAFDAIRANKNPSVEADRQAVAREVAARKAWINRLPGYTAEEKKLLADALDESYRAWVGSAGQQQQQKTSSGGGILSLFKGLFAPSESERRTPTSNDMLQRIEWIH